MAGYKNSILSLAPRVFMTFDGDAFDPVSHELLATPANILDESGRGNVGQLHNSAADRFGYRLGMTSQVKLETFQQYSIGFGFYGRTPTSPNIYEKAFIEIPHNAVDFAFPLDGKFTIVWMSNKTENEELYRSQSTAPVYNTNTFERPMIKKPGVFNVRHIYPWASSAYMDIQLPDNKSMTWTLPQDYHNADRHMALVWNTFLDADTGTRSGTASLYVDGLMVVSAGFSFSAAFPVTGVNSPFYLGGVPEAIANHGDRNCSNWQLDQFAVFAKALTASQIGRLFKKTVNYQDMIRKGRPSYYFQLQDIEDPNTTVLERDVGTTTVVGNVVGGVTRIARNQPGPEQVNGAKAILVQQSGQVIFTTPSGQFPIIPINTDYSFEMWFAATGNAVASLLAMNGVARPYNGLNVTLNMHDNQYRSGALQVQETEDEWGSVPGNYNDGQFHHLTVVKRGNYLELWIDGNMIIRKLVTKVTAAAPGQISIFGSAPGRLATDGRVAHLAWYGYALQEQQINARAAYRKTYKIRGQVTLRGIPYRANVRLYSHFDGKLLQEIFSNANDGEYLAELYDNRLIDIVVLNASDPTIRYRVYGPVTPSEYVDDPI